MCAKRTLISRASGLTECHDGLAPISRDLIKARATSNSQVIQTTMANPLDKFQLGVRKLIEDLIIQRMADNDKTVTRYMDDGEFQRTAFPILAKEICEAIYEQRKPARDGTA